jgi:hypothetical protein
MSTEHPNPANHPVEDGIAAAYTALVADLATTLDLTAGAADATHPATYTALTTDLSTTLDINAGLTAIVGTSTTPTAPSPTSPLHTASTAAGRLSHQLRSLTSPERLSLRSRPAYSQLRVTLDFATDCARGLDHATHIYEALDHALHRDRDHGRALDLAHNLARDLDVDLDVDLRRARARDRARARARNRDLDLDLDLDLTSVRGLVRGLVRALNLSHVHDRSLAGDLTRALDTALFSALFSARGFARDLTLLLDLGPVRAKPDGLKQHDLENLQAVLAEVQALLAEVGDDFVGADLRAADHLTPAELTGVRWSLATLWPPSWEDRVRAASVKIEPGVFRISGDGWRRSFSEVGT